MTLLLALLALPVDDIYHATVSATAPFACRDVLRACRVPHPEWWAIGLTAAAGLGKEAVDALTPGNRWDWRDCAANAVGLAVAGR